MIFEKKGIPENWDRASVIPVQLGLTKDLYKIPVLVQEKANSSRLNEPVTVHVIFDKECLNKSWNNSIRVYEEDKELNFKLSNVTFCKSQFLKEGDLTWEVNVSSYGSKDYLIYYSSDDKMNEPSYSLQSFNTTSWIPSDGDAWTEKTVDWSREGGSSGFPTNDTKNKIMGNASINITGTFDFSSLGLTYNPSGNISGVSNGWFLDAWIYVDNVTGINGIKVRLSDNNDSIYVDILNSIQSGVWYHFEKELKSTEWLNWTNFDASNGIDYVKFYLENNTPGLTRTLKVDALHFKKQPLKVKVFPEDTINVVSTTKIDSLKNISYENLKKTLGNYNFRIKVDDISYGGKSYGANVACYEGPKLIQYMNGSIEKTMARICVWK